MISGAAGSVALVAAALAHSHGLQYLLAATVLAGLLQIIFGLLKLDVLMRFVSRSVRTGFRSEEHTSELQSLMRISYAVFCLKKKNHTKTKYIYMTITVT